MMTEQIANDSHIDATLCQMGSEGMPQCMNSNSL